MIPPAALGCYPKIWRHGTRPNGPRRRTTQSHRSRENQLTIKPAQIPPKGPAAHGVQSTPFSGNLGVIVGSMPMTPLAPPSFARVFHGFYTATAGAAPRRMTSPNLVI